MEIHHLVPNPARQKMDEKERPTMAVHLKRYGHPEKVAIPLIYIPQKTAPNLTAKDGHFQTH